MPVPVGQMGVPGGGQPTCFQKIRMGFMMGCMIGGATGVLLGGFASLRMGLRGAELIKQTGKVVAQSGGSFGVFMAVAQGATASAIDRNLAVEDYVTMHVSQHWLLRICEKGLADLHVKELRDFLRSFIMMEVCINNNNQFNQSRPKRDFRFQVIEVCQGPKWFVWPSKNRSSSTEEIDENHNKDPKTTASTSKDFPPPCATQNGYGAMRRSVLRSSKRMEGGEGSGPSPRTASEPASRRLSLKKDKAQTEPLSQGASTFKILSIAKKWESFDATDEDDDEEETELSASCQTLVLNH